MFGASHFQKEWSEKIVFWVSYSKNKFHDYKLTDWWTDLHTEQQQVDYNKLACKLTFKLTFLPTYPSPNSNSNQT